MAGPQLRTAFLPDERKNAQRQAPYALQRCYGGSWPVIQVGCLHPFPAQNSCSGAAATPVMEEHARPSIRYALIREHPVSGAQ